MRWHKGFRSQDQHQGPANDVIDTVQSLKDQKDVNADRYT
jgi:hypothetical protein